MVKILFADGDKELSDMYKEHFQSVGYSCLTAVEGEEILKVVEKEKPNIVCLDIRLYDSLSSGEVLKRIRQIDPKIKVIMLSVLSPEETMDRLKRYDVEPDGYIEKPMLLGDFDNEIKRVLSLKSHGGLNGNG